MNENGQLGGTSEIERVFKKKIIFLNLQSFVLKLHIKEDK